MRIFIDDGIDSGRSAAARLAEGDFLPRHILQFDGHVFEDVSEPRPFVLPHASQQATRFLIRAAVFGETGKRRRQRVDEVLPQAAGGPRLERTQIEIEAYYGEARVERRADIDGSFENAHGGRYSFAWTSPPAAASRVCKLNVAPATKMCNRSPSMQTGCPSLTSLIDE